MSILSIFHRVMSRANLRAAPSSRVALTCALVFGLCAAIPVAVQAQAQTPRQQLTNATLRLVPYDFEGSTLHALADLSLLNDSLDERVSLTSRFLSAAASVDLYVYATLSQNAEARSALAQTLGTSPEGISEELEHRCEAASIGFYTRVMASYRTVASCVESPNEGQCGTQLRQVADRRVGASAAARLLLLGRVVDAVGQSMREEASNVAAPLVAVSGPLCGAPSTQEIRQACEAARAEGGDQTALARAVYSQALVDIAALEEAREGNDPFVNVVSDWVDQSRQNLGWLGFPVPLLSEHFSHSKLPRATSEPAPLPFEYLVLSSSKGASFALSPTLIIKGSSTRRLDQENDLALPGKNVFSPPFTFRPVVRPIKQVTDVLRGLRMSVGEIFESLGDDRPAWLQNQDRTLGIVIEEDMMMTDVARFMWSARDAGYENFALVGRHDDGSLAAIPVVVAREDNRGASARLPTVEVGPTGIRLFIPRGANMEFERTDSRVGANVARHLNGHNPAFAIHTSRPWMAYGWLFPTIDAIMHAGHPNVRQCVLLLP